MEQGNFSGEQGMESALQGNFLPVMIRWNETAQAYVHASFPNQNLPPVKADKVLCILPSLNTAYPPWSTSFKNFSVCRIKFNSCSSFGLWPVFKIKRLALNIKLEISMIGG